MCESCCYCDSAASCINFIGQPSTFYLKQEYARSVAVVWRVSFPFSSEYGLCFEEEEHFGPMFLIWGLEIVVVGIVILKFAKEIIWHLAKKGKRKVQQWFFPKPKAFELRSQGKLRVSKIHRSFSNQRGFLGTCYSWTRKIAWADHFLMLPKEILLLCIIVD